MSLGTMLADEPDPVSAASLSPATLTIEAEEGQVEAGRVLRFFCLFVLLRDSTRDREREPCHYSVLALFCMVSALLIEDFALPIED